MLAHKALTSKLFKPIEKNLFMVEIVFERFRLTDHLSDVSNNNFVSISNIQYNLKLSKIVLLCKNDIKIKVEDT